MPHHRPISLQKKREEEFYAKIRAKEEAEKAKKKKKEDLIAAKKKQEEDRRLESERKSSRRSTRRRNAPVSYTDAPAIRAVQNQEVKPKKREVELPPKQETYCLCQQPIGEDKGSFWLGCEVCENWFHPKCVGLPTSFARKIADGDETWVCPECAEMTGKFGLKAMEALQAAGAASTAENTGNSGSPQRKENGIHMETSPNANKNSGKIAAKELSL